MSKRNSPVESLSHIKWLFTPKMKLKSFSYFGINESNILLIELKIFQLCLSCLHASTSQRWKKWFFLYIQTVQPNSRFDYNFLNGESNRLLFSTAWMNGNISSFKYIIVYIQDKTSIILIFIFKMFSVFVFIWLIISYQNEFVSFFIYIFNEKQKHLM